MKKSYLQLKIVSTNLQELNILINKYKDLGFVHDGTSQQNNEVYWTFMVINNGLVSEEVNNKMNLQDLNNKKTVMIKPKGLINYREMEVTPTQKGFTISNYGNKKIEGNEYLYEVNTQEELEALDIM